MLELKGIKKIYDAKTALRGIDLSIKDGDSMVIFGPNGSGKTTLMKIISGIMSPTEGELFLRGAPARGQALRKDTFYLGHKNSLYNGITVLENLEFTSRLFGHGAKGQVEPALRDNGLWERRHDPVRELSQGMKRRLALARGFITGQGLIVLDEPFAGLDMKWRNTMVARIEALKAQGRSLIMSTHLVEEGYRLADYIVFMERGEISFIKDVADISADEIRGLFCPEQEAECTT